MSHFVAFALIAGVLAVDERAGWQSLLAQPVFSALLVGLVTGEMQTAIAVGLGLELIWLAILPMRGRRKPDSIAGAIAGTGTAALLVHVTADPRVVFVGAVGILVGLLAGEVGAKLTAPLFTLHNRYLSGVDFRAEARRPQTARRLLWLQAASALYIFVVEAATVLALTVLGYLAAEKFTLHVSASVVDGFVHWRYLLPALGAASLIHIYWYQHMKRVLVLSAVMVILVLWLR